MPAASTYSDRELADAVGSSESWRGVLRHLGLRGVSAGVIASVRSRADRLGIDYSHFRGQRRWAESDLREAVRGASTWLDVVSALGLSGSAGRAAVKGHAARLGLDVAHLAVPSGGADGLPLEPSTANLDRAGSLLAAAWFTMCGHNVSWPLEPSRYDLLVGTATRIRRVQVKTTTVRAGAGWKVYLSTSGRERVPYDPDEIDEFFVIDGDLDYYLIPVAAVGGIHAIHLGAYVQYRLTRSLR